MTVFVDDMYKTKMGNYGRMKMSHMIAELEVENTRLRAGMRYALGSVNALASHKFDMLSTNDVPVINTHLSEARAALSED